MSDDSQFDRARARIEGEDTAIPNPRDKKMPAAGPHATKEDTNEDATPGAGSLPSEEPDEDVDAATG